MHTARHCTVCSVHVPAKCLCPGERLQCGSDGFDRIDRIPRSQKDSRRKPAHEMALDEILNYDWLQQYSGSLTFHRISIFNVERMALKKSPFASDISTAAATGPPDPGHEPRLVSTEGLQKAKSSLPAGTFSVLCFPFFVTCQVVKITIRYIITTV